MTSEIIVAVIAALGGLSGSVIGMVRSSRLVNYRIDQLEKKVGSTPKFFYPKGGTSCFLILPAG